MNTIRWNSYTLAELLTAVDNGQDVPVAALALAARSVLDGLDDATTTIHILDDDVEAYRAELYKANATIESVRAGFEELLGDLS